MHRNNLLAAVIASWFGLAAPVAAADTWPRFRGHNGDGQSDGADIPSAWTDVAYAWRVELPGLGHSSPVVWNNRVFVTSAEPATAEQIVLCRGATTSRRLWERRFHGESHAMHNANSYATSTPAVDADHVYVAWKAGSSVMLVALTHDGDVAWGPVKVGALTEAHGFGTSPVVVGDLVYIANDTDVAENSTLTALDRRTGDVKWRVPCGVGKTSYATPVVWNSPDGRPLLLAASMSKGLTAYEPATGRVAWNVLTNDLPDRCVSSPVLAGGNVLVSCGSGNNGLHLIAVQLGAADDPPKEVYRLKQSIPNIPTPVVVDDMVFMWYDRGVVTCFDAATGKIHWRQRVGGNFHSSPVRIGDRILCISLTGEAIVLAAKKEFQLLGRTQLGEPCTATPAVADDRVLIRTETSLLCVGPKR